MANDCSIAASDSRPALIIDCASEFAAADAAAELLDAFASFAEASEAVESALCCPAASSDAIAADFAADVAIEFSTAASFSARVFPKSDVVSASCALFCWTLETSACKAASAPSMSNASDELSFDTFSAFSIAFVKSAVELSWLLFATEIS